MRLIRERVSQRDKFAINMRGIFGKERERERKGERVVTLKREGSSFGVSIM